MAAARRLEAATSRAPGALSRGGLDRLEPGGGGFAQPPGQKGGRATGKNPTDKGKPGSKRHLVSDAQGIPLADALTAANIHDSRRFAALLDAISPLRTGRRGRSRHRPAKLHADKGYDYRHCRAACRRRGIKHRIARKGIESKEKLGRHRWVIERTLAWLTRRRLTIRYERLAAMHQAFLHLGCALICFNFVQRFERRS